MVTNENTQGKAYDRKKISRSDYSELALAKTTYSGIAVDKKKILRKPTKTISGVAPLTVVLPFRACDHGTCTFCPTHHGVPQSYTPLSPAIMRARMLNYRPARQVEARLKAFEKMGHPTDKVELIILGGTFLQYPKKFKYHFIKSCYDALNASAEGKLSSDLEEAKKINETARHRCVAMCIEIRPDNCSESEIKEMLDYGCTRVELGIQMPDDKIYRMVNRGHTVKDVIEATRRLKDSGFKIGYHIMPGLPGSSIPRDLEMFSEIFSNDDFKPDQLKLYPCQVIKGAELEEDFYEGKYKPYTEDETKNILIKMVERVPEYCRVMRMMREIPPVYVIAGLKRIDLRTEVEKELKMKVESHRINEIRMREIGFAKTDDYNTHIKFIEYSASKGREFFIQAVNKEGVLFGLARLRFPDADNVFIDELKGAAVVRELHVYGRALNLGVKSELATQHSGLGKELMKKAEEIAKKNGFKKIAVISGVGVRRYYTDKMGYKLIRHYMIKEL
ncbi:tRNA uridine(34) 5-carboxymethylaminomethyl modification radical SAM/GNAT enzyme Elp3 [Candidatus Pacearchaeota archaeon]|nr:tRNA uridine(34) 5-carboxymethylaminomethyl modification radical SAM/GNAT enzyme Elp3 [Candidatus Pacearchaeota archaeon]